MFLGVRHFGVEVSKLDMKPFRGDGDEIGEGFHYSGIVGGPFHGTRPAVA